MTLAKQPDTNEFGKDVVAVNNASIRRAAYNYGKQYELQINNQYFLISEDMLESLAKIVNLPDNIALNIG